MNCSVLISGSLEIPMNKLIDIPELPEDPPSLRKAYREAVTCLSNNCPMSAVAMLHRALQIVTRDILGAKPGNLADELTYLKNKPNKLGIPLSSDFHENSYIIKEVGNHGAHPDKDPDLIELTQGDAEALHELFLQIVFKLFIEPV